MSSTHLGDHNRAACQCPSNSSSGKSPRLSPFATPHHSFGNYTITLPQTTQPAAWSRKMGDWCWGFAFLLRTECRASDTLNHDGRSQKILDKKVYDSTLELLQPSAFSPQPSLCKCFVGVRLLHCTKKQFIPCGTSRGDHGHHSSSLRAIM